MTLCRFVLQPGMLPEEARLAHDLLGLRQRAAALEVAGTEGPASDFADVVLLVDGVPFRSAAYLFAANYQPHSCMTFSARDLVRFLFIMCHCSDS